MKDFLRLFKYILPQWPRIIAVVLGTIIVALLLSLSFMTLIPMLKVMMGEEGLHSLIDKKPVSGDMVPIFMSRIIAHGWHDQLIQTCPLYQRLYETQLVKT